MSSLDYLRGDMKIPIERTTGGLIRKQKCIICGEYSKGPHFPNKRTNRYKWVIRSGHKELESPEEHFKLLVEKVKG